MADASIRYYFDANALWKFYRDEKGDLNIRRLVSNSAHPILISLLTRLEFVSVLMKYFRQGHLKRRALNRIVERLIRDTRSGTKTRPFLLVSLPPASFQLAESFLLQYADKLDIGSDDCLHLAIVTKLKLNIPTIIMVTSDNSLQKACEKIDITVYDPETGHI